MLESGWGSFSSMTEKREIRVRCQVCICLDPLHSKILENKHLIGKALNYLVLVTGHNIH